MVVKSGFLPPSDTTLSVLSGTARMERASKLCFSVCDVGVKVCVGEDYPGKAFQCFRSAL